MGIGFAYNSLTIPPNYEYSFFDSFNASPALGLQVGAPAADMAGVVISSDVEPTSIAAPPVVYHAIVQSAKTKTNYLREQ